MFIVGLVHILEPRSFVPKEFIIWEIDEVHEFYFVNTGTVDVGYSINRKSCFVVRYRGNRIIGACNMILR